VWGDRLHTVDVRRSYEEAKPALDCLRSASCYNIEVSSRWNRRPEDYLPDVRDGLTRLERVILTELSRAQAEREGRNVPTAMLYGRVVEHVNVSVQEFQRVLQRLVGK
jgi:hypothetical protein